MLIFFFKISCSINPFLIPYRKIKRTSWKIEVPSLNIYQTFIQQFLIFTINCYQSQDQHYRNKPLTVFWTQERMFRYLISNVATSIRNSTIPFYFYFFFLRLLSTFWTIGWNQGTKSFLLLPTGVSIPFFKSISVDERTFYKIRFPLSFLLNVLLHSFGHGKNEKIALVAHLHTYETLRLFQQHKLTPNLCFEVDIVVS